MFIAGQEGRTLVARPLINARVANQQAAQGVVTALLITSQEGHTLVARPLLDAGAEQNNAGEDRVTALCLASQKALHKLSGCSSMPDQRSTHKPPMEEHRGTR